LKIRNWKSASMTQKKRRKPRRNRTLKREEETLPSMLQRKSMKKREQKRPLASRRTCQLTASSWTIFWRCTPKWWMFPSRHFSRDSTRSQETSPSLITSSRLRTASFCGALRRMKFLEKVEFRWNCWENTEAQPLMPARDIWVSADSSYNLHC
jgi:hypothetical protein